MVQRIQSKFSNRNAMASQTPNPRCHTCRIGFIEFEGRTAHRRYLDHMGVRHHYKCIECDLSFISVPHLKFHIKTVHDTPCGTCGSLCEFECAETGLEMMKFSDMNKIKLKPTTD